MRFLPIKLQATPMSGTCAQVGQRPAVRSHRQVVLGGRHSRPARSYGQDSSKADDRLGVAAIDWKDRFDHRRVVVATSGALGRKARLIVASACRRPIEHYVEVISLKPLVFPIDNLARGFVGVGDIDGRFSRYRRRAPLRAVQTRAYTLWGEELRRDGNEIDAAWEYRKVLSIDPNHAMAAQGLQILGTTR